MIENTFGEIQTSTLHYIYFTNIKFVQGLPDDILDTIYPETGNFFIFDNIMGEKDAVIVKLFTKKSYHGNLSIVHIVENLFHHSKVHRTISMNASYLCLTKNVRDVSQIIHLAKQLYPNNTKFFQQAYQLATKELICTYLLTFPHMS